MFFQSGKPLTEALKLENLHPYIVMTGPTPKKITRYYIVLDGKFINVIQIFVDSFYHSTKILLFSVSGRQKFFVHTNLWSAFQNVLRVRFVIRRQLDDVDEIHRILLLQNFTERFHTHFTYDAYILWSHSFFRMKIDRHI